MPTSKLPAVVAALLALAVPAPAYAFTPVSELKDVTPDHWAYAAIQSLVEKYQVMEGFPDKSFKGTKTLSRYELAAALAKVMAKVEELISSATGQPISVEPGVNPEDLRTIARLQREFRDELEVLKGRVDTLDTRVNAIEKRARVGGELRSEYRDFLGNAPQASAPFAEFRERARINLDAALSDEVSAKAALVWDTYGARMPGNAFITGGATNGPTTEMYVQRAYGSYTPGWMSLHGGLVNPSDVVTLGSTLKNPFTTNVWREGAGGYGFVGTPGLNLGSTAIARVGGISTNAAAPAWWLPGTDVVLQSLDPNATQGVYARSNYSVTASGEAGPFNASVAVTHPGAAGRDTTRLATNGYPASLPQPEDYMQGARMLASVGGDFGFVHAQLAAKSPGSLANNLGTQDKTVTGTVDVGSDAMGLSLQAVSRTAFNGNFAPTNASATLASNDLFGTGFGLGLAANAGTLFDTSLATGAFVPGTAGKSLLNGLGGADYVSYGLYLRLPGFSVLPNITIAAQQTGAGSFTGNMLASGVTLQADVLLFQLPKIQVEYSFGKFDPTSPTGAAADNSLLNQQSFITNEQLSAQMVFPF
ncbi:MAG: hypothetical protein JWM80_4350 [Cyanobacteria bacterium RYN_339]|nr:hypothetical protein [Cyanobacteria bacterium RYN_339]